MADPGERIDVDDGTARIELRRTEGPGLWAVVDVADLDLVQQYRWRVIGLGRRWVYAMTSGAAAPRILMHRLILDAPDDRLVDHVDGNGLNNRRSNLRLATFHQNSANRTAFVPGQSSRYKGVSWQKTKGTWKAQIKVNRVSRRLGAYATEVEAAMAYDAAAREAFGEFALPNFPNDIPDVA